jgi:predicted enzyme related to lactoylglutathione lyase
MSTATPHDAVNWFEIPTADLDRATLFYQNLLSVALRREVFASDPMSIFPSAQKGVGGALVQRSHQQPSTGGALLYLNCDSGIAAALTRLAATGEGAVILPETELPNGIGWIAIVRDSEGNCVGLHQHPSAV